MESTYRALARNYRKNVTEHSKRLYRLSAARLILFVSGTLGLWFLWTINLSLAWIVFASCMIIFLFLIKKYETIKWKKQLNSRLEKINISELDALAYRLEDFDTGEEHKDILHPFAHDLDLFGNGSLFQYLNRAELTSGKQNLARRLKNPMQSPSEIIETQKAVDELADNIDWRQKFQALNQLIASQKGKLEFVFNWINDTKTEKLNGILKLSIWVVPPIMILALSSVFIGWISFGQFLWITLLPFGITLAKVKEINKQYLLLSRAVEALRGFSLSVAHVENQSFNSSKLEALSAKILNDQGASKIIEDLRVIVQRFDQRNNLLVGIPLNAFLLWDIRLAIQLEAWKEKNHSNLRNWFEVLAQFEALSSLANFKKNHESFSFPQPVEDTILQFKELGHPLIKESACVKNSNEIPLKDHFVVLTGANMAGKSTFLRTLGINLILAMNGSVVSSTEFKFKPIGLFTGMRTADSLQENTSYFHAELKRLQHIIQSIEAGNELFILLDEILKGTNSTDKEIGSKKLVQKLLKLKASGVVATHDLALCELEKEFPKQVRNLAFETQIIENDLHFDYKLREGICQTMNASFLLKKMGIVD